MKFYIHNNTLDWKTTLFLLVYSTSWGQTNSNSTHDLFHFSYPFPKLFGRVIHLCTIVSLLFLHKIFFSFFQNFEILFIICVKILIKSKGLTIRFWIVDLLGLKLLTPHHSGLQKRKSRQSRLFDNNDKSLFIICYNHYLSKISNFKNQVLKLNFQI